MVRPQSQERRDSEGLYEIINFDFASNEYVPVFELHNPKIEQYEYEYKVTNQIDLKLNEIEDIYLMNYDRLKEIEEEELNLIEYIVQENDTLFGLELKFNISQQKILKINEISDDSLIPGMKIKLPAFPLRNEDQEQSLELPSADKQLSFFGRNLMDEIMSKGNTRKFQIYYVTEIGNIQGVLTINEDIILFDPQLNQVNQALAQNLKSIEKQINSNMIVQSVLNFQACMCVQDVLKVSIIDLPRRMSDIGQDSYKEYVIQIQLAGIRKRKLLQKNTPISVYFRILEENEQRINPQTFLEQTTEVCQTIANVIKSKSEKNLDEVKEEYDKHELTVVPFYDTEIDSQDKLITRTNKIMGLNSFIPKQMNQSNIISQDQLVQIVSYVPSIFKTSNWKLVYSNVVHGSSFQTLLHQTENRAPLILTIKDLNGWVFGSFMNDFPKYSIGKFYGTGETFLWRFKDLTINVYPWMQANQDFIHCDQEGLAIGCGDKFGIYLSHNVTSGYTSKCETFQNEVLNETGEFVLQFLEIWGLDE